MDTIRALVADPSAPARLALREVPAPTPSPAEAVVAVEAASLNRGEVRALQSAAEGWRRSEPHPLGRPPSERQNVPIVPSTAELRRTFAIPPPVPRACAARCSPQ